MFQILLLSLTVLLTGCEGTPWLQDYTETVLKARSHRSNERQWHDHHHRRRGNATDLRGRRMEEDHSHDRPIRAMEWLPRTLRSRHQRGTRPPGDWEEGRIHVDSIEDALRYLNVGGEPVYTNSGLVFVYDVAKPFDPETQPVVHS